jgi:metal-responsive CopG/Arc/MetJ family transcriptional regulator
MNMVKEFDEAIDEILSKVDESEAFKRRLKKLILNSLENSYQTEDIIGIIEQIKGPKGG